MSSELPQISTPDAILRIKKVIDAKQGDPGRLEYISEALQKGKKLFHSDQIYLEKKIQASVIPQEIKKPVEPNGKIKLVKKLIALKFGDAGRLKFILQTLQSNRKLYQTDENYLKSKNEQFIQFSEGKKLKRRIKSKPSQIQRPEIFKTPSEQAQEEIIKERIVATPSQDIPEKLQGIEEAVLSPEPQETADMFERIDQTSRIREEIDKERNKISKLKHDQEQLKLQRDELAQLISYRQEYEIKINREKEILEKEIKIEQAKVKEKDRLVEELIKNQSKLIQTKTEREVLLEQIKIDKEKSEEELKKKQQELDELKKEYEELQNQIRTKKKDLDDQIKNQKEKNDQLRENLDDE